MGLSEEYALALQVAMHDGRVRAVQYTDRAGGAPSSEPGAECVIACPNPKQGFHTVLIDPPPGASLSTFKRKQ